MTKYLKAPPRQLVISVSELNQEITVPQQAKELVRECSYQVISGCLEAYSHYQASEILLVLLPLSANRLIDVCLPYFQHSTPILARYILFDHKLRGIRICSSGNAQWPITRCDRIPPPAEVKKYYREKCIAFREDEVMFGFFCLQLMRCRIGLLFMSEIMRNGGLIDIPNKYQYQVLSVVHDTPKEQGVSQNFCQIQAISKLKQLASEHFITIVHAGLKIVPSLGRYYYSKSFIAQGPLSTPQHKTCLGEKTDLSFMCNLNLTMSTKIERHIDFQENSITEAEVIEGLYINKSLKCYESMPEVKSNPHSKAQLNEPPRQPDLILMNLWYLFKAFNLESPFVLPYPFTKRCEELYKSLIQLEKHALISKEKLIKIYRYKAGESQVKLQLRVYKNLEEMIESNPELFPSLIYVYTNDDEEVKALKNNKKYGDNICNCDTLNPVADEPEPNSLTRVQKRKVEVACNRVLKERMKTIDQMLALFMELKLSREEIQLCFVQELPSKIKKSVKPLAIHFFLLHANKEKIIAEIVEAQLRLQQQLRQTYAQAIDVDNVSFRQRVQKAAVYKMKITGYVQCHRCSIHFHKSLAYHCQMCNEWLCYECLDFLTNKVLTGLEDYKCAMCFRRCHCKKCQGGYEPKPPEMHEEAPISQPAEGGLLDAPNCSICQMMDEDYRQIMFECGQCKKVLCYNCERGKLVCQQQQKPIEICKKCDDFNTQRQTKKITKNSMPFLMPVNLEERWQEKQQKTNHIPPAPTNIEPIKTSFPPIPPPIQKPIQKTPIIQQKSTKSIQSSSALPEKKPIKDNKSRKSRSSSPSSPPRRKRSKSRSSSSSNSSSRSRSRDRHHKKGKKEKIQKYTIRRREDKPKSKQKYKSKSKQKQTTLDKESSSRTHNEQRPLWNAGSQHSSRPSFSQQRHQSREGNLQTKNTYQSNNSQNNRGGYQMRDYRNTYNNQGSFNNASGGRNDNRYQRQDNREESSRPKKTQDDRNNNPNGKKTQNTLIQLLQIDYEDNSY